MSAAGLLLAAGRGRRSGLAGSKLLLPYRGQPVAAHTVNTWLAAGLSRLVVVLGFDAAAVRATLPSDERLTVVENPGWAEGMASSLRVGLAELSEADSILLGFADMPWVDSGLVRHLADHPGDQILVPTQNGRRGHPVRFPRRHFAELSGLSGDRGAFRLLQEHPVEELEVGSDAIFRDVDQGRDLLPRVIVRGGGDLATGVAHRLFVSGFRVAILELPEPRMIRSTVSFARAVYEGHAEIEGVRAELRPEVEFGEVISVVVDPSGVHAGRAEVLVDARMLKRADGTHPGQAPLVIALGPGFTVGEHAHYVVETQRGHQLGRVLDHGEAIRDTGVPGELGGESLRRVVRSPAAGRFEASIVLGQEVEVGALLGHVAELPVVSQLRGTVRGLLRSGLEVVAQEKLADVDPRSGVGIHAISDKSRAIGGGVLEAIMRWKFGMGV